MGILLPGVNSIITQRSTKTYGLLLEKAVLLSLEILILVLEKDLIVSDYWRPLYQVLFLCLDIVLYLPILRPDLFRTSITHLMNFFK